MTRSCSLLLSSLLAAVSLSGCSEAERVTCTPDVATATYASLDYEANTVAERALRAQFKAFTQPLKDAETDLVNEPTAAALKALLAAGSPSLRSVTTPYYAARIDGLLEAFEAAAGNPYAPTDPPPATGGKYGAYIFSPQGVDLRQGIEKGMFAATYYHRAVTLMAEPVTAATLDRVIALFGAHPSFPADDKAMSNPDELAASYAERRDAKSPTAPGPYLKIKSAMITAQHAIGAGSTCQGTVDQALATVRLEWERAIFATVTFYLNDVASKLSKANPTETDLAGALHGFGELVAFIEGWRTLPVGDRIITDPQIDTLLAMLGAPQDGPSTAYKLVTDTANALPKLTAALTQISTIYGFTAAELEQWKTNL